MPKKECDVDLRDDDKYGWRLRVSGDCTKVLEDINEKLGEYGRRYLEERLDFDSEGQEADELSEES